MKKIEDEFADLNISRQRKYQLRKIKQGLCRVCGKPAADGKQNCEQHSRRSLEPQPE